MEELKRATRKPNIAPLVWAYKAPERQRRNWIRLIAIDFDHTRIRSSAMTSVERKSWTKEITNQNTQLYKQSTILLLFSSSSSACYMRRIFYVRLQCKSNNFFLARLFPPFFPVIIILQQKNKSNSYYRSVFTLCILMRAVSIVKGGHSNTTMCRTCWALNGINLLFWMNAYCYCIY